MPGNEESLSVLGSTVRSAIPHVECFPAPKSCSSVTFTTEELSSVCPVTKQPDISRVEIYYEPDELCVESKSLKLFLWSFRDAEVFAEQLAADIGKEILTSAQATRVRVELTQRPRGGIELQTVSEQTRSS